MHSFARGIIHARHPHARIPIIELAGEDISEFGTLWPAESEINFAVKRVELVVNGPRGIFGLNTFY